LDRVAHLGAVDALAVLDNSQDDALAFIARITGELGRAMLLGKVEPDVLARLGARPLPRGSRLGLLLSHGGVEAGTVHLQSPRAQRILGEVVGEAVGVIELERRLAG